MGGARLISNSQVRPASSMRIPPGHGARRDAAAKVPYRRRRYRDPETPGSNGRLRRSDDQALDFFPQGLTCELRNTRPLCLSWPVRSALGRAIGRLPRTRRPCRRPRSPNGLSTGEKSKRLRETPAVSETLARTSADGSQGGAPAPQQRRRPAWLTPVNLTIIIITLLALILRVYYQYTRPGFLLGVTE